MPLHVVPATLPPPVVVEPSPTPAPPAYPREQFTWTPPGGTPRILSDHLESGIMLGGIGEGRAVIGLDMPPQEEFDTELAGGGEVAEGHRWAARQVALPIVIHADTLDELNELRRQLMDDFRPKRDSGRLVDGVLSVAYPNGFRRHLDASYSSGLDVAEHGRQGYPYIDAYTVILKARDPLPYGDELAIDFTPDPEVDFYAPAGDEAVLHISGGTIDGEQTAFIDGKEVTPPTWVFDGPMATAELRNLDTGKLLRLNANLTAGQRLIVRTKESLPASQKITNAAGSNRWTQVIGISNFPNLWTLRPGENRVSVLLTGTVAGQSELAMTYRPRYLSA